MSCTATLPPACLVADDNSALTEGRARGLTTLLRDGNIRAALGSCPGCGNGDLTRICDILFPFSRTKDRVVSNTVSFCQRVLDEWQGCGGDASVPDGFT